MCAIAVGRSVPTYHSTLIGRDAEADRLTNLFGNPNARLVTVTGIGGIGKTRLVSHAASLYEDSSGDDVLFVPLASITDPALVLPEIGKHLEVIDEDVQDGIRSFLAAWRGILILDNFEQVISAAGDIAAVLPTHADVTVVVTSQRPLQIDGEQILRLNPLPVPGEDTSAERMRYFPSVQLLLERTQSLGDSLELMLQNQKGSAIIAEICRKLDGIPLAIELAAPRLESLTPEVVLSQLQQGQQILSSRRMDTPDRQRTMHTAISWSFRLLPNETQQVLLWLGPFAAGFDLEIVERVTQRLGISVSAVDIIEELFHLNLIRRVSGSEHLWYTLLVSIREFCLAELIACEERDAAEQLVGEYALELAGLDEHGLPSPMGAILTQKLERNMPTIRSAINWSLRQHEPELPMLLVFGTGRFLEQSGKWREGVRWANTALEWQDKLETDVLASGLIGMLELQTGGHDLANAMITQSRLGDVMGDLENSPLQVAFLVASGGLAVRTHQLSEAEQRYKRALDLGAQLGLGQLLARAQINAGHLCRLRGEYQRAEELLNLGEEAMEAVEDYIGAATASRMLANVANIRNDFDTGLRHIDRSIAICREHNLTLDLMYSLVSRLALLAETGQHDAAFALSEEILELCERYENAALGADVYYMLGAIAHEQTDYEGAARYFLAAIQQTNVVDLPRTYAEIGNFLASALAKTGRYQEAAVVLGGLNTFIEGIGYHFHPDAVQLREDTLSACMQDSDSASENLSEGGNLTTNDWVRKMRLYAHRLAADTSYSTLTSDERWIPVHPELTTRESQVLQLITQGESTKSMATQLSVSPRTITTHIANMMSKLDVNSRAELVAKTLGA